MSGVSDIGKRTHDHLDKMIYSAMDESLWGRVSLLRELQRELDQFYELQQLKEKHNNDN